MQTQKRIAKAKERSLPLVNRVESVEPIQINLQQVATDLAKQIDPSKYASTADYNQDQTVLFVHEKSAFALMSVNRILCMFRQIQPDEMLNRGPYLAQVDVNQCMDNKGASSGEQNVSSSSNEPKYTCIGLQTRCVQIMLIT